MAKLINFISGFIITCIGIMHLIRYYLGWEVYINKFEIPLSWSLFSGIILILLSISMLLSD